MKFQCFNYQFYTSVRWQIFGKCLRETPLDPLFVSSICVQDHRLITFN